MTDVDDTVWKGTILHAFEWVKSSIPADWVSVINRDEIREDLYVLPNLYIGNGDKWKALSSVRTNVFYKMLLVTDRPAAEKMWVELFLKLDVIVLWKMHTYLEINWNVKIMILK